MSSLSRLNNILRSKDVEVDGRISLTISSEGEILTVPQRLVKEREDIEEKIEEARREYERIIGETEVQRQRILEEAEEQVQTIEKKAYSLGYEQGLKNGYEDGFKEAYEKNIDSAKEECEKIKDEGYVTLLEIKDKAEAYIKENKENILKVSMSIAEQVLREKFEAEDAMNRLLENIIKEYGLKKDLIIKVNPIYTEQLQNSMSETIKKFELKQKIFVISDSVIEKGNAVIETKSGKLTVGIDCVLDKLKEELL